jgi:hypothetical protein
MRSAILFLCLLSLGLSIQASSPNDEAKDTDPKRWKSGFVVTLRGDTISGRIKATDFLDVYYDYQRMVAFKDNNGVNQYSPNELSSFSYSDDQNGLVTLQSVSSPDGDGHVFLKVYCAGDCKVYGLTVNEVKGNLGQDAGYGQVHSSLFPSEKKYIQLGGGQFFQMKRMGFKKSMKEVFANCPHILSGLESKQYSYDNWQDMVRDYNRGCR